MRGSRLVPDPVVVRHTPRTRRLADKLQELTMRSPDDVRNLEKLVDYALARLDRDSLPLPFVRSKS